MVRICLEQIVVLARELERDRLVPQPPSGDGLGDDGALVADDRIVDPGLERIAPHRLEHAAGDDDDVNTLRADRGDRRLRSRPQQHVLGDQRAIEVAGDRRQVAREVVRELQPFGFDRKSTRAVRSAAGSDLYDFGITPFGHFAPRQSLPTYLSGLTMDVWMNAASGCLAVFA